MQANEELIRSVVQQVLSQMNGTNITGPGEAAIPVAHGNKQYDGRFGIFHDVDEAVEAATIAFERLSERTKEDRGRIIAHIRRISIDQCEELGTMEMNETKVGRLEHK